MIRSEIIKSYVKCFCDEYNCHEEYIPFVLTQLMDEVYSLKRKKYGYNIYELSEKEQNEIVDTVCKEYKAKLYFGGFDSLLSYEFDKEIMEDAINDYNLYLTTTDFFEECAV